MAVGFDWHAAKNEENRRKHGVSFGAAQRAFLDPRRIVAKDVRHSGIEARFYCFGCVDDAILTVRFTYRDGIIRIIGAGYWRRGRKIYHEENAKIHA